MTAVYWTKRHWNTRYARWSTQLLAVLSVGLVFASSLGMFFWGFDWPQTWSTSPNSMASCAVMYVSTSNAFRTTPEWFPVYSSTSRSSLSLVLSSSLALTCTENERDCTRELGLFVHQFARQQFYSLYDVQMVAKLAPCTLRTLQAGHCVCIPVAHERATSHFRKNVTADGSSPVSFPTRIGFLFPQRQG